MTGSFLDWFDGIDDSEDWIIDDAEDDMALDEFIKDAIENGDDPRVDTEAEIRRGATDHRGSP